MVNLFGNFFQPIGEDGGLETLPGESYFSQVTMLHPPALFVDRITDLKDFQYDINSCFLDKNANACNNHLKPNILCPWGCLEYVHKSGMFELDLLFQKFLLKVLIKKMSDEKRMKFITFARDDYIRDDSSEYDFILLNPE